MKRTTSQSGLLGALGAALLIATPFALASAQASAQASAMDAGTLTVEVKGVQARGGTLYISVQTEEQFMKEDGVAGTTVESPEAGAHSFTFEVPAGAYAVSVWHDDNDNGVFDMSDYGMPLDGWAMSNGRSLMGPPTFDAIGVAVTSDGATVSETVLYSRTQ